MLRCVEVERKEDIESFLYLPQKLYSNGFITQDWRTETKLLKKRHPLSDEFEIFPFIVLEEIEEVDDIKEEVVARCILTIYPKDKTGYVGFFESVNNQGVVDCLLNTVKEKAINIGLNRLVGPVDCSFWIKYRFKVNKFDDYYTSEPYNKEYYKDLWSNWGFNVCDKYYSNQLRIPKEEDTQEKCKKRLDMMLQNGCEFKHPTSKSFEKDLRSIFRLMSKVYSKFPIYKSISEEQFVELYKHLVYILNFDMVFLAYKDKELVGFLVAMPDCSNLSVDLSMLKLVEILRIKNNPERYVILYMGADSNHYGLGGAFAELSKNYLQEHSCASISALIHEGNTSGVFYRNLIEDRYEYVLMDYMLDND